MDFPSHSPAIAPRVTQTALVAAAPRALGAPGDVKILFEAWLAQKTWESHRKSMKIHFEFIDIHRFFLNMKKRNCEFYQDRRVL